MSKISADFGDINLAIETEGREAFDIYRILQQSFKQAGMEGVDAMIKEQQLDAFILRGPAKGLRVERMDLAI